MKFGVIAWVVFLLSCFFWYGATSHLETVPRMAEVYSGFGKEPGVLASTYFSLGKAIVEGGMALYVVLLLAPLLLILAGMLFFAKQQLKIGIVSLLLILALYGLRIYVTMSPFPA